MKKIILAFFLLLVTSAHSQESVQSYITRTQAGAIVSNIRQAGTWSLCDISWGDEGSGQGLFHRHNSSWETATSGGGVLSAYELAVFGVPRRSWETLLSRKLNQDELTSAREVFSKPVWTWMTRERTLQASDLETYSDLELTLMRNEVFALHGRTFQDPYLKSVFSTRTWYRPDPKFSEARLSAREKANIATISSYQKKSGKY